MPGNSFISNHSSGGSGSNTAGGSWSAAGAGLRQGVALTAPSKSGRHRSTAGRRCTSLDSQTELLSPMRWWGFPLQRPNQRPSCHLDSRRTFMSWLGRVFQRTRSPNSRLSSWICFPKRRSYAVRPSDPHKYLVMMSATCSASHVTSGCLEGM